MMSGPIFPNELDTTKLRLGDRVVHNDSGDWSADLTYDDLPLHLQTPWLRNVFGTSCYINSNQKASFSLSFELRDADPTIKGFKKFLNDLDTWMKKQFEEVGIQGQYFSSIRPPKKQDLPSTLRLKLKTRKQNFDCQLYEGKNLVTWPTNSKKIEHGDKCRMVIELLPVWSANKRVGISWKIVTIQKVEKPTFRVDNHEDEAEEEQAEDS